MQRRQLSDYFASPRVHTIKTDQNSLTFPWRKFKYPWKYRSQKFYEFSNKDTSGQNILALSGWNVKSPDISLKISQISLFPDTSQNSLTVPWPWKKSLIFPWRVWTLSLFVGAIFFPFREGSFEKGDYCVGKEIESYKSCLSWQNQSTDSTSGSTVSECRLGNGSERGRKTVSFYPYIPVF